MVSLVIFSMQQSYYSKGISLRILVFILVSVVVEQLDDEVDVGEEHAAAAVPRQVERVERLRFRLLVGQKLQKRLPLVPNHLAAGKASDGKDLCGRQSLERGPTVVGW